MTTKPKTKTTTETLASIDDEVIINYLSERGYCVVQGYDTELIRCVEERGYRVYKNPEDALEDTPTWMVIEHVKNNTSLHMYDAPEEALEDIDDDTLAYECDRRHADTGLAMVYDHFRQHPQELPQALRDVVYNYCGKIL